MELTILLNPFQEKVESIFNFLALTIIIPMIIKNIKKMTNKKSRNNYHMTFKEEFPTLLYCKLDKTLVPISGSST